MPAPTNVLNLEGKKEEEMAGISLRMMMIALTRGVERKKLSSFFYVCYIPLGNSVRRKKKLARNSNDEIRIDPVSDRV